MFKTLQFLFHFCFILVAKVSESEMEDHASDVNTSTFLGTVLLSGKMSIFSILYY